MKPLFSVVIPTYNRAPVIERTIESVLSQTFDNWELIVIDDGSKDNTAAIMEKYIHDKRIFYQRFPNMGANVARNIGIGMSRGEYIAFLDSDDTWTRGRLDLVKSSIGKENFYITDFRRPTEERTKIDGRIFNSSHFDQMRLAYNLFGGTFNLIAPKSLLLKIGGFDIFLPSSQDHDIYNRLLEECKVIYLPGEFSIYYSDTENRISYRSPRKLNGLIIYYNRYKHKMNLLARLLIRKKIAVIAFNLKNPIFYRYFTSWFMVWIMVKILKPKEEKDLFFSENFILKKIK